MTNDKLCVFAGTKIHFIQLDKEMTCSECGRKTNYIDLDYLNTCLKPLCSGCVLRMEGMQ